METPQIIAQISNLPDVAIAFLILVAGIILSEALLFAVRLILPATARLLGKEISRATTDAVGRSFQYGVVVSAIYFALVSIAAFQEYHGIFSNSYFVLIIFTIAYLVERITTHFIKRWLHVSNRRQQRATRFALRFVRLAIYIVALLGVLDYFEVEITPLIAALGIGGLAIGLALNDSLSNFFAGLYIVSASPIQVGDFIEFPIEKINGYVEDVGWRATRLRTLYNTTLIIPNTRISQSIVVNTYLPNRQVEVPFEYAVPADMDLERIERVSIKIAKRLQKKISGAVRTFKPYMRYTALGEKTVTFNVVFGIEEYTARFLFIHEYIKAFKRQLEKEQLRVKK